MKKIKAGDFITFKYVKADGDESNRAGFVVYKPTNLMALLEITDTADTDLSESDIRKASEAIKYAIESFNNEIKQVAETYGLEYKNFMESRIFNPTSGVK